MLEACAVFEYQNIELSVFCQYMMMFFALARLGQEARMAAKACRGHAQSMNIDAAANEDIGWSAWPGIPSCEAKYMVIPVRWYR